MDSHGGTKPSLVPPIIGLLTVGVAAGAIFALVARAQQVEAPPQKILDKTDFLIGLLILGCILLGVLVVQNGTA